MTENHGPWKIGRVQVYTGNGKGKTTAALGLALRAVGAGAMVFIAQFAKARHTSELSALARFEDAVTIRRCGGPAFIRGQPSEKDRRSAARGLTEARQILQTGRYHLVILDEANIAVHYNLFSINDLLDVVEARPEHVELVITGRHAHPRLIERADLVTEMTNIKHYYDAGQQARTGIEL